MARPYRLEGEDTCYHITSRGNERQPIFDEKRDCEKFFEYVTKAKQKFSFYLYAYVLMSNHFHLLLETRLPNISKIMHYINTAYTTYYNVKHKRSGHLFQGRYKSIVVDRDNYLLELSRYIHLNPVRAKKVEKPEEYLWSSYLAYTKKGGDGKIDKERVRELMGMSEGRYAGFVLEGMGQKSQPFKDLYAGFILGKTAFVKDKLEELKDQIEGDVSYKDQLQSGVDEREIISAVEQKYGKSLKQIRTSRMRPMREKQVLVYLLKRMTGLTNPKIGELVGITYSAVSKAWQKIEEQMMREKGLRIEVESITSRFKG